MCLFGCQSSIQDGEIDLLFFRKVDPDDGREPVERAAQGLLLGRAHACTNQVRPQLAQLLGEPTDLDMVAAHRCRRLRCPHQPSHHAIQGSFFGLGAGEERPMVTPAVNTVKIQRMAGAKSFPLS